MGAMRRVAAVATALLLAATGCGRLAQEQDTLAPRVTPPQGPTLTSSSPSEQAASAPVVAPGCAGTACAVIASPAAQGAASTSALGASASTPISPSPGAAAL